jgi:glycosyltransferase AglD
LRGRSRGQGYMKRKHATIVVRLAGAGLVLVFLWLTYRYFDGKALLRQLHLLFQRPDTLAWMLIIYGASFWLRALAWKSYVGKPISLIVYAKGIFFSLLINHIAPFKVGDIARVAVLAKQKDVSVDEAVHSVAVMRLLDMLVLCLLSAWGMYAYVHRFPAINATVIGVVGIIGVCAIAVLLLRKSDVEWIRKHHHMIKSALRGRRGVYMVSMIALSWLCEAVVIYEMTNTLGMSLTFLESAWVNSITVSGQVFQIAPGGMGTYEAVMAFAITRIVPDWSGAYMAAIMTHAFKFVFSYLVGIAVLFMSPRDISFVWAAWKKGREKR